MAYLEVFAGDHYGRVYPLASEACLLGREHVCQVQDVFEGKNAVSRKHARIVCHGGQFMIEDLGSHNGTRLNDQPVTRPMPLREGDRLAICDVQFLFHAGDPPADKLRVTPSDFARWVERSPDEQVEAAISLSSSGISGSSKAADAAGRFQALLNLLSTMGDSLELDAMLDHLLEALLNVFVQADRALLGLRGSAGEVEPVAIRRRNSDDRRLFPLSRSIVARVVHDREAILSLDAQREFGTDSITAAQTRSVMCAPLLDAADNVLGILQVDAMKPGRRFVADDLKLLAALTPQATFALRVGQLHRQSLKQAAVQHDLELAAFVQARLLPASPPAVDGFEFFSHYRSAQHVGGDYYDYVPLPDGRLAFAVADVTGKGVAAALIMAELSGELKSLLKLAPDVVQVVQQINTAVALRGDNKFITMVLGVLDPVSRVVSLVNAGHMAPLLRRTSGDVERVGEAERGLLLGVDADYVYEQCQFQLRSGETLTLYTDGVTDAVNSIDELYHESRLISVLQSCGGGAESVGRAILTDIARFVGRQDQNDDICLICLSDR